MRDILFRGKGLITDEWIIGDIFQHGEQMFIMADNRNTEVDPKTVGQFTGLCDKNGTKIFEGDIVSIDMCGEYDNYVVSYDSENARFVIEDTGFTYWSYITDWSYINERAEIIGNIHDNPELIGDNDNAE